MFVEHVVDILQLLANELALLLVLVYAEAAAIRTS
jgi:hypothetical protein